MKITAKSEGSTKVKVKAKNNKTYTVSVKVKPVLNSKTFSTAPGKRVTVKVQGGIVKSAKHLSGDGSSEITKKSSKSVTLTATGEAGKDKFSITTKKGTTLKFSVTVNSSQSGDTGQSSDTAQTSDTQRGLNDESSFGTGTITKTFSYEFATSSHKTEGVNTKELATGQSSDVKKMISLTRILLYMQF